MKFKRVLKKNYDVQIITKKEDLNLQNLSKFNPNYIFFPHWSWKVPAEIYEKYECIIFHMTDLPYGKGGSPLQNLIVENKRETKISALRCVEAMDAGPIYMKKDLSLNGNAEEILKRCSLIIFKKMIPEILSLNPIATAQVGKPTFFKRRTKEQGNLKDINEIETIYNYIRMLDGEGYPNSFLETESFIFKFSGASLKSNKITACVEIIPKGENDVE